MRVLRIDLNCDMGESFGRYTIGRSEAMKYVSSVNIACGFHAGDPSVMRSTVSLAKEYRVAVGAHPGFPDLLGFGRRELKATREEVRDYVVYQVGALKAFVEAAKIKLQHVKPHGALYTMAAEDEELSKAIVEAILEIDPELILVTMPNSKTYDVAKRMRLRVAAEGFVDLKYAPDGTLILERIKVEVDPLETAKRAVRLVKEGKITAVDGSDISINVDTIGVHGDAPNAVEVVQTMRNVFKTEGIEVIPLREFLRV